MPSRIDLTQIQQVPSTVILGRSTSGTGDLQLLTPSTTRTLLGLTSWATAAYPANAAGVLTNDGSGNLSWSSAGSVSGTGTANLLAYWSGTTALTSLAAPAAPPTGQVSVLTQTAGAPTWTTLYTIAQVNSEITAALAGYQPLDAGLTSIAGLTGSGYLRATATNVFTLSATIPWSDITGAPSSFPTPNAVTFNNSGTGDASGTSFNGSVARTISFNTVGAAAASHSHGNITNAGAIGSTANLPVITTTSGVLTTGAFGTTANTFCQGNDARLSDARTPTAHVLDSATHTISGKTAGQVLLATAATTFAFTTISGDATLGGSGTLTLSNTAVTVGSYGSATGVATFTVDSKGRLTAAATTPISGLAQTAVTNLTTDLAARVLKAGDTMSGLLTTAASTTGTAGLRLPHGTAPSAPVNGDVWTTTAGLFARINGTTVGPFSSSSGTITGTGATNQVAYWSGASTLTGSSSWTYTASSGSEAYTATAAAPVSSVAFRVSSLSVSGALAANVNATGAAATLTMTGTANATGTNFQSALSAGSEVTSVAGANLNARGAQVYSRINVGAVAGGTIGNVTALIVQNDYDNASTTALTVTNMHGIHVVPFTGWTASTGSVITNYYALRLEDPGTVTNLTITNRYGLFQVGADALNVFAGRVSVTSSAADALSVAGSATVSGNLNITNLLIGGAAKTTAFGVELGCVTGTATTPYIDFHAGATAVDYDSRIIALTGTGTVGAGDLQVIAARLLVGSDYASTARLAVNGEIESNSRIRGPNGTEAAPAFALGGTTVGFWRTGNDIFASTSGIRMTQLSSGAVIAYRASLSAPTATAFLGAFAVGAYDGAAWDDSAARMRVVAAENWTTTARGADLQIRVRRNGTTTQEWHGLTLAGSDGTLQIIQAGTAASPAVKFVDTGLGLYRSSTNVLGISCAGTVAATISQGTGAGSISLFSDDGATDGSNVTLRRASTGTNGGVLVNDRIAFLLASAKGNDGTFRNTGSVEFDAEEAHTGTSAATRIEFHTTPFGSVSRARRYVINGAGIFHNDFGALVGASDWDLGGSIPLFQLCSTGRAGHIIGIARFNDDAEGPRFIGAKNRTTVLGTFVATQSGDTLVVLEGRGVGTDVAQFRSSGSIAIIQDGAALASAVPSRISITTVNAAGAGGERLRIYGDGGVQIGGTYGTSPGAGCLLIGGTTASTTATTGALVVSGGVGVTGAVNASGSVRSKGANAGILLNNNAATGAFDVSLVPANLTDNRTVTFADATGTVALGTGAPNCLAYWSGTNTLTSSTNWTFNGSSQLLSVGSTATSGSVVLTTNNLVVSTTGTTASTATYIGLYAAVVVSSSGTGDVNSVIGLYTDVQRSRLTGVLSTARSLYCYGIMTATSGTTTNLFGVDIQIGNGAAGHTVTSATALRIAAIATTGTVSSRRAIDQQGAADANLFAGVITSSNSTVSTSTTTGAVVVTGGVGIGGALYAGGAVRFTVGTPSSSTTSGALVVTGGVGISGNLYVGNQFTVTNQLNAGFATITGSLTADGVSSSGTLEFVGELYMAGSSTLGHTVSSWSLGGTTNARTVTINTNPTGINSHTINLPAAASGRTVFIRTRSAVSNLTVTATSGTVDGAPADLTAGQAIYYWCDGSVWRRIL